MVGGSAVSIWRPVPPSDEYVALGCLCSAQKDGPPAPQAQVTRLSYI